jgi:outer membrane protein TolC
VSTTIVVALLSASPTSAGAGGAQQAGQPAAPVASTSPGSPQPPVMTFPPEGIPLLDAVRVTLRNDPNIRRREADLRQQQGVVEQQAGSFDSQLSTNLGYSYRQQNLTTSTIQSEQTKRDSFRQVYNENLATAAQLKATVSALQQVRNAPPGQAQLNQLAALDPATAASLQVIETLTQSQGSNAQLQQQLLTIRQELVDQTVNQAQAGAQQAADQINKFGTIVADLGPTPTNEFYDNGTLNFTFSRLFRNGITFSPYFTGNMDGTNFVGKPVNGDFGGKGLADLYTFRAGGTGVLPLSRGRGMIAVAGAEQASLITQRAADFDLRHQSAASALATAQAYWALRAAQETVEVANLSLGIQAKLLDQTRALIRASELPQAELARVQASDARARARLQDAQRNEHEARVALATSMGISASDQDATLPRARDAFPPPPDSSLLDDQHVAALFTAAPGARLDVSAAASREEAGGVLVQTAETQLRPQVNLSLGGFYTALNEGSPGNALKTWAGPSGTVALDLQKPFGNNLYRGQLQQAKADNVQRQIATTDLRRQVKLNIVRAARSLADASERVKQAQAAVDFYQKTIDAELQKFRNGESTLIDTILTQDQQTDAMLTLVSARQVMAGLLAQLRYETGTLVTGPEGSIADAAFVTVPVPGGRQ